MKEKTHGLLSRTTVLLMTGIMTVSLLSGCSSKSSNEKDANTIRISIASQTADDLMDSLAEKFPDINFEIDYYSGSGTSYYMLERLKHHDAGDIFYYTSKVTDDIAEEYLLDLSGYSFVGNYDTALLNTLDVDGAIYQVPGPVVPKIIAYNKTLFEENNWKVPENFQEFVEVCEQIRKDQPEITPLGIGMQSQGWLTNMTNVFSQCGSLSTPTGRTAEKKYLAGNGSIGEIFADGLNQMGQLIDAGAFEPIQFSEEWDFSPKSLGDRKAAMYVIMRNARNVYPMLEGTTDVETYGEYCTDEFELLPFYGIEDGQEGIGLNLVTIWGLNKELGEESNEKN